MLLRQLCLAATCYALAVAAPLRADTAHPQRGDVLFWSQAQRLQNFRQMERLFPYDTVRRGSQVHALPQGIALQPQWLDGTTLDGYMRAHQLVGVMVLQQGKVRLQRYAQGFGPQQRWTSFSVAKSFTSTLLGAAVKDGHIHSLDDPLQRYLPQLKGQAYGTVTVRQLLTMSSGIAWNEDYADPHSDVAQMYSKPYRNGVPRLLAYMAPLPRAHPAGAQWNYNTGETDLLGLLVQAATGQSLASYLSQKIWRPYGMAQDAYWLKDDQDGRDTGGSGLSATLGDYARFGEFLRRGARADGQPVLPADWLQQATRKQQDIGTPGMGYGYQWWTYADGGYAGIGIFGQLLQIDPQRQLVIVQLGAWPVATSEAEAAARRSFVQAVIRAVDQESPTTHAY